MTDDECVAQIEARLAAADERLTKPNHCTCHNCRFAGVPLSDIVYLLLAALKDRDAEIARHHRDFERWEVMADDACKRADFYKSKTMEMADTVDHLLAVECPGAERRAVALKRLAALRLAAP